MASRGLRQAAAQGRYSISRYEVPLQLRGCAAARRDHAQRRSATGERRALLVLIWELAVRRAPSPHQQRTSSRLNHNVS
jgi:hypothetical protein